MRVGFHHGPVAICSSYTTTRRLQVTANDKEISRLLLVAAGTTASVRFGLSLAGEQIVGLFSPAKTTRQRSKHTVGEAQKSQHKSTEEP